MTTPILEITLTNSRRARCWLAVFSGSATMPNGVALPLPYANDCPERLVAMRMLRMHPSAAVVRTIERRKGA